MRDYLYDGSFEGALSAVYIMLKAKEQVGQTGLMIESEYQINVLRQQVSVATDPFRTATVSSWILNTFGEVAFRRIAYAYLSESERYGTLLFNCLKSLNRLGSKGVECLSDPWISEIYKLYNRVCRESHLLLGLLRFVELENGLLYASFEPTCNILTLLVGHFRERLGNQTWVIHDTKRGIAAFYDRNEVYIKPLEAPSDLKVSDSEALYRMLWSEYFSSIAIEERLNPRQQRQMMPKKYWKFLVETPRNMNVK